MKKMLETSNVEDNDPEEQRTALSSLRGQGKQAKVGSVRVGTAKVSETPGVLSSAGQIPKSSSNAQFKIYQGTGECIKRIILKSIFDICYQVC